MQLSFYKYQGTGNDFVMIDNRDNLFVSTPVELIKWLCDRKFGIGADGLILLQNKAGYDFEMLYFNSDGRESTMCGNGGRCIVKFAYNLGLVKGPCRFLAIDGPHDGEVFTDGTVSIKMKDVDVVGRHQNDFVIDTGSPHYVQFCENLSALDIVKQARQIRYNEPFAQDGINVNFVSASERKIQVRTYERGVEDETLSCGTGVVATALSVAETQGLATGPIQVHTQGGLLQVKFKKSGSRFTDIYLSGPAEMVFKGEITLP